MKLKRTMCVLSTLHGKKPVRSDQTRTRRDRQRSGLGLGLDTGYGHGNTPPSEIIVGTVSFMYFKVHHTTPG